MEDLEQHDGVAEVVGIGGILRVGKPRPVDLSVGAALGQLGHGGRGLVGRDSRTFGKGVADVVVEVEGRVGVVDEEEDDEGDGGSSSDESHAFRAQDLANVGFDLEGRGGGGILVGG